MLKSLLKTLADSIIGVAVHESQVSDENPITYEVPANGEWFRKIAPFDGFAEVKVEGVSGIEGVSIRSANALASNVPSIQNKWISTFVLIVKGKIVEVYINGTAPAKLILFRNINSAK